MAARRVNPYLVKVHRCYGPRDLATLLDVHKNTVRHWQSAGLGTIDGNRPILFLGETVRAFLTKRNTARKRPCPPGTLYCFRCRAPRPPALGMVDFRPLSATSGNLSAICGTCETTMHRRARGDAFAVIMPGLEVTVQQASPQLKGSFQPSLNCNLRRQIVT